MLKDKEKFFLRGVIKDIFIWLKYPQLIQIHFIHKGLKQFIHFQ